MLLRLGANPDFHPAKRNVLKYVDRAFKRFAGRDAILISGRDREHGSGSFHYYGLASDWQTKDLSSEAINMIVNYLVVKLPSFQIIYHDNHLHIEPGDELAKELGAMVR